jgi:hypothetical protein
VSRSAGSNPTNPAVAPVLTTGEIFDDGTLIELVRSSTGSSKPDLLLWNGTVATIGPKVTHGGRFYESSEIPLSIYRAVLLPRGRVDCEPLRQLHGGIATLFVEHLGFADRESRLLASFCMVTWLADRLAIAPAVQISGPDQAAGVEVLRLLGCLCRHPLLLAEVTPGSFRSLPLQLSLTLLLSQREMKPAMSRLLCASSYRGVHLPGSRGTVVDAYGPKAIFGGSELGDLLEEGCIRIAMVPAQSRETALSDSARRTIADHFQPRLLHFRLKNLSSWRDSRVDAPAFTSESRRLACALGACLSEDPEFAREIVELLRPQDDEAREERLCAVDCVLIEVLWGLVHHGTEKQITVAELAKMATALLRSRGESLTYSAEEIGWKLRALGVPRHTSTAGRHVLFHRDNRRKVHHLARVYDLPCGRTIVDGCPNCS